MLILHRFTDSLVEPQLLLVLRKVQKDNRGAPWASCYSGACDRMLETSGADKGTQARDKEFCGSSEVP